MGDWDDYGGAEPPPKRALAFLVGTIALGLAMGWLMRLAACV